MNSFGFIRIAISFLFLFVSGAFLTARAQTPELDELYRRGAALFLSGKYAEAIPIAKEYMRIASANFGEDSLQYASSLYYMAVLEDSLSHLHEAEAFLGRALEIRERTLGPDHKDVAQIIFMLAGLHRQQGRYADAERGYLRAIAIGERILPADDPEMAGAINGLAQLYQAQARYAEAEPLYIQALKIREKAFGPGSFPELGSALNNLANLYQNEGRSYEAEELYKRSLDVWEKARGADHIDVANSLNNLGTLYQDEHRYDEAESLLGRSLSIREKLLGSDHPDVGQSLNNIAQLYRAEGRASEAEPLLLRALAIQERVLGPEHPDVGLVLANLAYLYLQQNDLAEAAKYLRRSTDATIRRAQRNTNDAIGERQASKLSSEPSKDRSQFWALINVLHRAAGPLLSSDPTLTDETFRIAQWAQSSDVSASITEMAARGAMGKPVLAAIIRERQDLVAEWQVRIKFRTDALLQPQASRDKGTEAENINRLNAIDARIEQIDKHLAHDFPGYSDLVRPQPLSIADVQAQLLETEVFVLFLDAPASWGLPSATYVWAISKTDSRWAEIALDGTSPIAPGISPLAEHVLTLRCGLDISNWLTATQREACQRLTNIEPNEALPLPFDLAKSFELYQALFGTIANLIKNADGTGKHLIVVPSGPLTQLPLHVLITSKPDSSATGLIAYRNANWLARQSAITTLPSVASLKALRAIAKQTHASRAFIGFGNPLLDGNDDSFLSLAKAARDRQHCPTEKPSTARLAAARGGIRPMSQKKLITDVAFVRRLLPLPETADELCAVAHDYGAGDDDIYLGANATETGVKALSASGTLSQYRTIEFATHGALAGQMSDGAEPGLILTPPDKGTDEDDGYLSASEIGSLKLDADAVILSACNTAGAGSESAEALSGIARAFFYAGARSLLVSHWAVNSAATVTLITRAAANLRAHPDIGRAEALRRSELALIDHGELNEAHPAIWAPFVVVGEGSVTSTARSAAAPATTSPEKTAGPSLQDKQPGTKNLGANKARVKPKSDDWFNSIFGQ